MPTNKYGGKVIRICAITLFIATLVSHLVGCGKLSRKSGAEETVTFDTPMDMLISVADQRLLVLNESKVIRSYRISTGLNGVGEALDSGKTPRGLHQISQKLGAGAPDGLVFDSLIATEQIADSTWTGKPPVTTRVLLLDGREQRNLNTHQRMIYIHGSPIENLLGQPASGGCIRLSVPDIKELFELAAVGAKVEIFEESSDHALSIRAHRQKMYRTLAKSADEGDRTSIHKLCFSHRYGTDEVGLDYPLALRWCSAGAEANDTASMTLLAEILFKGLVAPPDIENGILWFLRAASLGHPFARKRVISILQDPNFSEIVDGQEALLKKFIGVESEILRR